MSAKTRLRVQYGHKGPRLSFIVITLVLSSTVLLTLSATTPGSSSKSPTAFHQQTLPISRVYPFLAYDEQAGATFTQDFTSLAFNVSAVAQTGADGVGPAYLLNGLTDAGYWYQVGVSWMWPSNGGVALPGFSMNYEVWDSIGNSIFPSNGGGISTLQVNSGDLVLLSLYFNRNDVVMQATDWNTTSSAAEYYPAVGANYFLGLPNSVSSNGFFTGLMTEEYHSAPYYGTAQPVVYQQSSFNISSAWLWVDEFNTNTFQPVFSDATTSPISLGKASLLNYVSFHGMPEAIGAQEFITGLSPIKLPFLETSTSSMPHIGEQVTITLSIQNPNSLAIKIESLTISTQFGVFDVSSATPYSPITGNSTFTASITIPTSVVTGNYTLKTVVNWHFDPQLKDWIAPDPLRANMTIPISGTSTPSTPLPSTRPPSTPPTSTSTNPNPVLTLLRTVLLPGLLAYAGTMALVVALVIRRERQQTLLPPVVNALICKVCGNPVEQTMLFCPNCGSSLRSPSDPATLPASPEPQPSP